MHRSSSSPAGFRHFKRSSPKCPGLSSLTLSDAGCSTGRNSSCLSSFVGSERATVHTVHTVHSPKAPWRPVLSKVNRQIQLLSSEAWPWAPAFGLCQACLPGRCHPGCRYSTWAASTGCITQAWFGIGRVALTRPQMSGHGRFGIVAAATAFTPWLGRQLSCYKIPRITGEGLLEL